MTTSKQRAAVSPFAILLGNIGKQAAPAKAKPAKDTKPTAKAPPVVKSAPVANPPRGRQPSPMAFGHLRPKHDPYARFPKQAAPEPDFLDQLAAAKLKLAAEPPAPPFGSFAQKVASAKRKAGIA